VLDMYKQDECERREVDLDYGDIWRQAWRRKPLDRPESDMGLLVSLVKGNFEIGLRESLSAAELFQYKWFKDL
jgi:hypothetical protein